MDKDSALIVWSEDNKSERLMKYPELRWCKDNIIVGYELVHGKQFPSYKTIYIDEPFAFTEDILKIAYDSFSNTGEELFVIFGSIK